MRPIIYCFQSCGVCGCMCVSVYVCVSVNVPAHVRMCPVKNVTDLVQVLLKVVLLAPWLLLMNTHFIICQWCSNHCWPSNPTCVWPPYWGPLWGGLFTGQGTWNAHSVSKHRKQETPGCTQVW